MDGSHMDGSHVLKNRTKKRALRSGGCCPGGDDMAEFDEAFPMWQTMSTVLIMQGLRCFPEPPIHGSLSAKRNEMREAI